jgi:uncharacterized protein YdaU (DUF1376 family)
MRMGHHIPDATFAEPQVKNDPCQTEPQRLLSVSGFPVPSLGMDRPARPRQETLEFCMANSDIWFPFYVGDYLADTAHLSHAQHGIYLLLLLAYYKNRGPLRDDDKELCCITRMTLSEWRATRSAMARFFQVANGVWSHKRADVEIAKRVLAQEARKKGAIIANHNMGRNAERTLSDAGATRSKVGKSQSHSESQSEPESRPHTHIGKGACELLRTQLNAIYHREPTDRWTCYEEQLLSEVALRPGVSAEFDTLLRFRNSLPAAERRYFSQSCQKLLENWTAVLDKARLASNGDLSKPKTVAEQQTDDDLAEIERAIRRMKPVPIRP